MTDYHEYTRGLYMVMFGPRAYRGRVVEPAFPDQDEHRHYWGVILPYKPSAAQVQALLKVEEQNIQEGLMVADRCVADALLADTAGGVYVWMHWEGEGEDDFLRWPPSWALWGAGPSTDSDPYLEFAERIGNADRLIGALWEEINERIGGDGD